MLDDLILDLYDKGCIKFGQFKLKSGEISPIYIDLKAVISYNFILNKIISLLNEKIKYKNFDIMCGVPYGAIVFSSIISFNNNYRQILLRKEIKKYGTKKVIEGEYEENCKCLLIEDTITTGSSIVQYVKILKDNKINVKDIIVICDRRLDKSNLENYNIESLFTIYDIYRVLKKNDLISSEDFDSIIDYYKKNKLNISFELSNIPIKTLNYRYNLPNTSKITKKIIEIMIKKNTNLCFSADICDVKTLIETVGKVGKHICILKLHHDIIKNFTSALGLSLKKMADELNFVIFEDRKYNDIGNTFKMQYQDSPFLIPSWSNLISVKSFSEGIYSMFPDNTEHGIIAISDMSNEKYDFKNEHIKDFNNNKMEKLINKYKSITGIVTQKRVLENDSILYLTPGVNNKITKSNDQNYRSVQAAIIRDNCDIIIVGSGIIKADNVAKEAEIYKMLGWTSYIKKINI